MRTRVATFTQRNLPRGTTGQAFQFLGAAIDHYCPEHVGVLQQAGTRFVPTGLRKFILPGLYPAVQGGADRRSGCATAPRPPGPANPGAPAPPGRAGP